MEWIIIVISLVTIVILKIGFNIHFSDIKKIKKIGEDKELRKIADKFPENKVICECILEDLNNKSIKIEENADTKSSLYIAASNKIVIANIKDTFTRIQTIAHECLHSIQNRKILLFNFIFSNIYLLLFIVFAILIIFNIGNGLIYINSFVGMSIVYLAVRNYLENEAMSKAIFVAEKYMRKYKKEKTEITNEEIETLMQNFDTLNKIGIPLTNFCLLTSSIIKIVLLCVISIIF